MGAAFGLVQLDKLSHNIALREQWFEKQNAFFENYADWFILPQQLKDSRTGWLAYALTIKDSAPFKRTQLQIFLEKRNIQTRTVFTGNILRQPGFKDIPARRAPQGYDQADHVMRGGILLACHHGLNDELLAHIHSSFEAFVKEIGA